MDANSSSQPFVSLYPVNLTAQAPAEFLDGKHTVFGRVVGGMEVLDKMEKVEVQRLTDRPLRSITMIVRVDDAQR